MWQEKLKLGWEKLRIVKKYEKDIQNLTIDFNWYYSININ